MNHLTLQGKPVKEGDKMFSPYFGEGVVSCLNYRKNPYVFEVFFPRKHWKVYNSHIYVSFPSESDNIFWLEP